MVLNPINTSNGTKVGTLDVEVADANESGILINDKFEKKEGGGDSDALAKNSAALTTFLLLNTMIGSGILNQPYVFKNSGILGGILGFIIASIATWISLLLLTEAGIRVNILEYSGLAKFAFQRNGELAIDWSIVISAFGAILGYILVIGETTNRLLSSWGCLTCDVYSVTIITVILCVSPLCLLRHFGHLAFLSVFSIFTIVLVLFLVIIGGPVSQGDKYANDPIVVLDGMGSLESIGSIVFALSCAAANFQGYISTKKESQNMESWTKITGIAVGIGAVMCSICGIAGYASFRADTLGDILADFASSEYDFFKVMVVLHLIFYVPVNFVIMRYSVVKLAWDMKSEDLEIKLHTGLSLFLLFVITSFILMMLSIGLTSGQAFSLILNITGGIVGSFANFILPSAIYLKVMPDDSKFYTTAKFLMVVGFVIMIVVLVATTIKFSSE